MESKAEQGCSVSCGTSQQHHTVRRGTEKHRKTQELSDTAVTVCCDMWQVLSSSCQTPHRAAKAASPETPAQVLQDTDCRCSVCSCTPASVAHERAPWCTWEGRVYSEFTLSHDLLLSSLMVLQVLSVVFIPGCWHALLQLIPEGEHFSTTEQPGQSSGEFLALYI